MISQMEVAESREQVSPEVNIGSCERVLSAALGAQLLLSGLTRLRSGFGLAMAAAGGYLAYRGMSGHCALYEKTGARQPSDLLKKFQPAETNMTESITIRRSPEELYQFWRDFTHLPRIMDHVQAVEMMDERRSRWSLAGPGNRPIVWEAILTRDVPNELIEWATIKGDLARHSGRVEFIPAPADRGTTVRVTMEYSPFLGVVGAFLAKVIGEDPAGAIRQSLRKLKQLMEAGEFADATGPSARLAGTGAPDRKSVEDKVDEASMESFPASDPPARTVDKTPAS